MHVHVLWRAPHAAHTLSALVADSHGRPPCRACCAACDRRSLLCSRSHCPCSREGALPQLLVACGGATGLLLLRSSRFVAARPLRSTNCSSPFRDQHGEDWATHNWGRPLRLRRDVYGVLSRLWAAGGYEFDSYTLHHATTPQLML